jgi:hypothetical protein
MTVSDGPSRRLRQGVGPEHLPVAVSAAEAPATGSPEAGIALAEAPSIEAVAAEFGFEQ